MEIKREMEIDIKKIVENKINTKIPVIFGVDFGHVFPMMTFPIGGKVKIDAKNKLKNFLFNTGLEFSYKNHIVGLGNTHVQKTIIDTQDSVYLHDYYFSNRKDKANSFALQLPLLFGYEEYIKG